ncbi:MULTISPECIES: DUF4434 domain-containing protein [unclassified Halomonas]|uniref:DUF4434 domain-containing protein n=1 Tax=unclassified Halomonas TaxID=2609666 RepID=UPI001C987C2D|nr:MULTISPECIES: DUF4434 domain-containing protein [unclassified Halomonas]MBY5924719.1 DUF4434 domain-containing protein [Halomonas sp. DP4Y7-2]MBY6231761.1 DUF4434 domain-containing protein [Halomonas sp. DP4Y7-1]
MSFVATVAEPLASIAHPARPRAKARAGHSVVIAAVLLTSPLSGVASAPADDLVGYATNHAAAHASAYSTPILFYQPQNHDELLTRERWQTLWQQAADHGVDTLIVQWTRYGDDTFGGAEGWLADALVEAERQGLELILGLHQDPAYYDTLPDNARFAHYWYQLLARSAAQQQAILQQWPLTPVGWYLPQELDDWLFRDPGVRDELVSQLASASTALAGPLHLSMFSGGFVTPQVYTAWAEAISDSGWQVWWQDDEGTRNLDPLVRSDYRHALSCRVGIVREAFSRTSGATEPFHAIPTPPRRPARDCHPDAVFSLRYMPWAQDLL